MADNLKRVPSGARRLTVRCHYCGGALAAPNDIGFYWEWLKSPDVVEFYRYHRDHAGAFADSMVGAEIEYDEGILPKQKEEMPPLMNLLESAK